ncbi:MAG: site-2 protease family protein [Candidatus Thermoplasmatota archaeon]
MAASVRIGTVLGIPIHLHVTFLIILPLFAFAFAVGTGSMVGFTLGFGDLDAWWVERYAFGIVGAVVFFATILAHELAHSYVAIRYGVRIKSITLMLFGGVASLEEIPRKPRQELVMAFAGPLTSLGIGGASYAAMLLMDLGPSDSVLLEGTALLLGLMAFYNVLLAGFNLLPAFPMDGGRMLRSYLATRMSHLEATRKAARAGRYIAIAMGIFGIFTFQIFLILIAFFVYTGAQEEERATVITDSLEGLSVRQIMTDAVQVVHPDTSLQQLLDLMFSTHHMGFPVVDYGVVGVVTLTDAQKVPKESVPSTKVGDIMIRDVVSVPPEMDAAQALMLMTGRNIGRLLVVDRGRLVGIVTKKDFLRAVDIMLARRRGAAWQYQRPPGQVPPPPPPPSPPAAYG